MLRLASPCQQQSTSNAIPPASVAHEEDVDFQMNTAKIVHAYPPKFNDLTAQSSFFDNLVSSFPEDEQNFLKARFFAVVIERYNNNVPFVTLTTKHYGCAITDFV